MQGMISKICLSQTMTTDDGSSRAQASVHEGVAERVVKSDSDLICGSFNRSVVKWLTDWNFPGAAYPTVWRILERNEDLNQRVVRDKTIFDMGFKPSLEYIMDTYGGEWLDGSAPPPVEPTEAAPVLFAEKNPGNAVTTLVDNVISEMNSVGVFDSALDTFRNLLDNAQSLEDFQKGLNDLYSELDLGAFTLLMGQALTAAELQGMASIKDVKNA